MYEQLRDEVDSEDNIYKVRPIISADECKRGRLCYDVGAIVTAMRAHWYAHLPYPVVWFLLGVGSLVMRLASL
jgi:hypothetical protein